MKLSRAICIANLAISIVLAGCAYRVGPTNGMEAGSRSIEIPPFANDTQEARLIDPVTSALRRNIQRDGTFALNTSDDADVIVTGRISGYLREELSVQPTDVVTVRDYRLVIAAHVVARDRSSGETLLDRTVTGQTTIRVGADLVTIERQSIPIAADDLAFNITSLLVDGDF